MHDIKSIVFHELQIGGDRDVSIERVLAGEELGEDEAGMAGLNVHFRTLSGLSESINQQHFTVDNVLVYSVVFVTGWYCWTIVDAGESYKNGYSNRTWHAH